MIESTDRPLRRSLAAITILATVVLLAPHTATATPYGTASGGPGYVPDGVDHWFCFTSTLPSNHRVYARSAMVNLDDTTDTNGVGTQLYRVETSSCGTSTDIWFREASPIVTGQSYRGYAPCSQYVSGSSTVCDRASAWIDPVQIFIENGGYSGNATQLEINLYKTFHHEAGHTAGVGHSSTGTHMMRSGHVSSSWSWLIMLAHDACHINNFFAGAPACTP